MASQITRRSVANDNDCLFNAIGYLCEIKGPDSVVAEKIASDPEMFSEPVLGMAPEAYQTWIQDHFNWGGETEIFVLSAHYDVEISLVSCEAGQIYTYNEGNDKKGRVYLLYTGQHYDPLVGVDGADTTQREEVKRFPIGYHDLDAHMIVLAEEVAEEQRRKLREKRVKKIKCNGCGHLCDDPEAFKEHCLDINFAEAHGDDFDYMCEEVEVVLTEQEAAESSGMPDFSNVELVHTFYDIESEPLSNKYLCALPVVVDGLEYPTVQHVDFASKFVGNETGKGILETIRASSTVNDARTAAYSVDDSYTDPNFTPEMRKERLRIAIHAKFGLRTAQGADGKVEDMQSASDSYTALRAHLLATGDRYIALVGDDKWTGVQAPGGVPQGKNIVGVLLMDVREELKSLGVSP